MSKRMFFNLILRLLLLAYMNFCITGILAVSNLTFSSAQKGIHSFLGILLVAIVIAYPIFTFTFLKKHFKRLMESDISTKISSIYDNIDLDVKYATLFTTLFLVRRLIYAITLNFLT